MGEKELTPVPVRSYFKGEILKFYNIRHNTWLRWIKPFIADLEKVDYKKNSKKLTVAQVSIIFENLGRPYLDKN
jgi:hypothetical protein